MYIKGENRGTAVIIAIATGIFFGIWQGDYRAGIVMGFFLFTLAIIKTIK